LALATGVGEALASLQPLLRPDGVVLGIGSMAGEVATSLLPGANVCVVEGHPAEWNRAEAAARLIIGGHALAAVPDAERYVWLEHAASSLQPEGLIILGDRTGLPPDLPPQLNELLRLPAQPVDASETVILVRL
jgi:hypothetical protein